jgi:F0F1-type ATP synthase assembly protein I
MEKKSKAAKMAQTATSEKGDNTNQKLDIAMHQKMFVGMALEMSWQLALAVLVPLIGGYLLDTKFHTTPGLTFLGLFMAFAGVFGVLRRILLEANRRVGSVTHPKGKA